MAEIRRVVPSNPISQFRQVAPAGGGLFASIAAIANEAYDRLEPWAAGEFKERSENEWREYARQTIGQNRVVSLANTTALTPTGAPVAPISTRSLDPNDPQNIADDAMGALGRRGRVDAEFIKAGLVRRGLPEHVAEAFAWNARDESGFDAGINEIAPLVPGSRGGFGLMQWTGPRRRELEAFAASQGRPVDDAELQLDFLVSELGGSEQRAASEILSSKDAPTAAAAIVNRFLRPAESNRARREAKYLSGRASSSGGAPMQDGPAQPAVVVQTAEGRMEPRMYHPLSHPILQVANAAGQVAYNAEVMNKAAVDLFDISNQFPLDPEGFQGAVKGYIDQMVQSAPERFRGALRGQLEERATRRFLGMVEERQRDTQQRAANSSSALMDRYTGELAEALASGDPNAIMSAQANLDDILVAREALPGLAWTPEQSDNVRIRARDLADRAVEQRRKEASDEIKGQLETIIAAREAGLTSTHEAILGDPMVQALHPELTREAIGWVALGEALPSFSGGTNEERAAAIADLRSMPVASEFQIDLLDAAEKRDAAIRKAWDESPMDAAQAFLPDKPPALPSPDDPNYIPALAARAAYAEMLQARGYTPDPSIFTAQEAKALTAALSPASPVEVRASTAAALAAGLGAQGARGFRQLGAADPVTKHAGMLLARGGDPAVAMEALNGQVLLKENMVMLPPKSDRVEAFDTDIATALSFLPNSAVVQADLMKFAQSIYASRAQGLDHTSDAAKDLMKEAVQIALGRGMDARGRTTGGVQSVGGHSTLLPPGTSGEALSEALSRASGAPAGRAERFLAGMIGGWSDPMPDAWLSATEIEGQPPSQPFAAGAPLPAKDVQDGNVRFVPVQGTVYRMEVVRQGRAVPVEGADGRTLFVDVDRLIQATR